MDVVWNACAHFQKLGKVAFVKFLVLKDAQYFLLMVANFVIVKAVTL